MALALCGWSRREITVGSVIFARQEMAFYRTLQGDAIKLLPYHGSYYLWFWHSLRLGLFGGAAGSIFIRPQQINASTNNPDSIIIARQ